MKAVLLLGLPLLLMAAQDAPAPYALATLNVQQGGTRDAEGIYRGGAYTQVDSFAPPAEHGPRDALIAFEGPGWESDKVAYRLYLDERNVPDIYGKRLPRPVLPHIGQGKDDYHAMADWGQDILQVNQSLGAGGIGVMRANAETRRWGVTQLGRSRISATVVNAPGRAAVRVTSLGFAGKDGPADLSALYALPAGSRITEVTADVRGSVPEMIAGIIRHPGVEIVRGASGRWAFIGTWGVQSLAKDELGMVLFYRTDSIGALDIGETDISISFCNPSHFRYAFAAAWIQEPGAPKTRAAFEAWAGSAAADFDRADEAPAARPCQISRGIAVTG
ncbi:DUF4861 domain-containing protein [Sphingomonas sp. LB-2]|uniref:DUF4861 domain-containing protein n=1 Tax=Sphingomonas caeni TaxID=2984949 RepID=UPI002232C102|nr:DUF4861 domain-containing protein [Sphingomonas caeni]MCW3848964.1 DUF4861 domain-containing protein [Sphingomonas caeni]